MGDRTMMIQTRPLWYSDVVARLKHLGALDTGWDGYRGEPVRAENAAFALKMLMSCHHPDAEAPQIVPGAGGDLQIEWHQSNGDIEIHVRAPNDVHAWRATESIGEDGEEVDLTNDFQILMNWIDELLEPRIAPEAAAAQRGWRGRAP